MERDGSYYPVAYYSRKFNDTEQWFSTTDYGILTIVDNLRHFKHILLGRMFKLFTDHVRFSNEHEFSRQSPAVMQAQQATEELYQENSCEELYSAHEARTIMFE